ncbi:MAG: hypothetical protein BWY27_00556 [Bacteroidetes bacterium ADurb.Bin234]|nr:MAG: hypothetical protein BWY27_00556 [Bacteroidetes bacterium ADurb.Bin234]
MKIKNYFILLLATLVIGFVSCKEKEPEPEPEPPLDVSVIQGDVTFYETETGLEGKAVNATVRLHKGTAEKSIKEIQADDKGFYKFSGVLNGTYTISAEFTLFGAGGTQFSSRSDSIVITKSDTITCDIEMIK